MLELEKAINVLEREEVRSPQPEQQQSSSPSGSLKEASPQHERPFLIF